MSLHGLFFLGRRSIPSSPPIEAFTVVELPPFPEPAPRASPRSKKLDWSDLGFPSGTNRLGYFKAGKTDRALHESDFSSRATELDVDEFLYEMIDQHLDYPEALSDREIGGTVRARLVFDRAGSLEKSRLDMTSTSRYLKVFVHRILRRTFAEALPISKRPHFTIEVLFDFEIRHELSANPAAQERYDGKLSSIERKRFFHGSHFSFYRSVNTWKDFRADVWADKANRIHVDPKFNLLGILFPDKPKGDPLETYRDDPEW